MMQLIVFQFVIMVSLAVEAAVFGLLPLGTVKKLGAGRDRVLSIANSFAGGIFLSSGFIHLLGDSQDVLNYEISSDIPVGLVCSSLGFLAIFFLEKVVFADAHVHGHDSDIKSSHNTRNEKNESKQKLLEDEDNNNSNGYGTTTPNNNSSRNDNNTPPWTNSLPNGDAMANADLETQKNTLRKVTNPIAPYLLLVVLCVHSVVSGVALGVQGSVERSLPIIIAIVTHKWVESFAVGVNLITMNVSKRKIRFLIVGYSLAEPLGMAIGMCVTAVVSNTNITLVIEALAGAIASGTFIYIAAIDIMSEEFSPQKRDKYLKAGVCFTAFALMSMLVVVLPHEHAYIEEHTHTAN